MSKLIKNYVYNLIYQIFVIIVPLITMPYLARILHAENMGIYSYVTSCASIINTIGLLGFYNYGDRQVAYTRDDKIELNDTFNELMSIRCVLCVIATGVYIIWAFTSEYTKYFLIYYPWLLTGFIDISWFFAGIEDMGPMVLKNFLIKLFNIICIFIFVHDEKDLWKYFALVALITLVANLSMYIQLYGKGIRFKVSFSNVKQHLFAASLLFLPQLASVFYLQVDKVMLRYISGSSSQVAFYDQAEKIVNIPFTVVTALSVVMMPRIANEFKNGNFDSIKEYVYKAARFAMMISIPILFGLVGIADNFIPWYLGDEYLPVIQAIWMISPIIITNTLNNIAGTQYLTAIDKTKILTISNVSAALVNILVNSILIPFWGFYGAAIATVLASSCCVVIQLVYMNKTVKIKPLLSQGKKYFLSACVMFVMIRILVYTLPTSIFYTALLIMVGIIIYFMMLGVLRDEYFLLLCKICKNILKGDK